MNPPRRSWTHGDVRRACEMRSGGLSYSEIATLLGRDPSSVQRYCYRYHEPPGPVSRSALFEAEVQTELRRLVAEGYYPAAIAREMRVSHATVSRHLLRLGLVACCGRNKVPVSEESREKRGRAVCERYRAFCAELGWPEVTIPSHARILSYLASRGPAGDTFASICRSLGWRLYPRGPDDASLQCPWASQNVRTLVVLRYVTKWRPSGNGRVPRYAVAEWLMARRSDAP